MSSYYGDSGRSAPSWDALDAGDDEVLDTSEVGEATVADPLTAVPIREPRPHPVRDRRLRVDACAAAG